MITFMRVDDRIIHGQIITRWSKEYPCDGIIAVNDKAATTPVLKQSFVASTEKKVFIWTMEHFLENAKKVFGLTGCMLLSGIAFGIVRLNLIQSIYAIPLGMLLAYLAYMYNSIIPAILLHMINNSLSVFFPMIYHGEFSYIICILLCVVFIAFAVVIKKFLFKKELVVS